MRYMVVAILDDNPYVYCNCYSLHWREESIRVQMGSMTAMVSLCMAPSLFAPDHHCPCPSCTTRPPGGLGENISLPSLQSHNKLLGRLCL